MFLKQTSGLLLADKQTSDKQTRRLALTLWNLMIHTMWNDKKRLRNGKYTTMERQKYNYETSRQIPLSACHSSACLLKEVCLSAKKLLVCL